MNDHVVLPSKSTGGRGWFLALPFLFVVLVGTAQAQDSSAVDSSQFRPYQVGFSAGSFVKILGQADSPDRYQVYGRYRVTRDVALRTALRYEQRVGEEHDLELAVRVGLDYVLRTDGPVHVYSGVDLVTGYEHLTNGNRTYRVGGAPLLGLLVSITPNISLSVEPRLVVRYSYFDKRNRFSDNNDAFSISVKGDELLILSVHF